MVSRPTEGGADEPKGYVVVLVGLLMVFDVVTVDFHLLEPVGQAVLLGASAVLLGGWGVLRWLDARMHRAHSRAAFADLARLREGRAPPQARNL